MPRFFFHVHDGTSVLDREGTILPDLAAAREIAQRFAGELLLDLKELADGEDWRVEITDQHGLILFTLLLAVIDAPAVLRSPEFYEEHADRL